MLNHPSNPACFPNDTGRLLHLPEDQWPEIDRISFRQAFAPRRDVFDDAASGAHLKSSTRQAIHFAYRRWLGWLGMHCPDLLARSPWDRVTPQAIKGFVLHLRETCSPRTIASQIGKLYRG